MKTLLLNLPKNIDDKHDYDMVSQPLGLAYISNNMKGRDLDTTLLDANAFHMNRQELLDYIKEVNPDILGLGVMTYQFPAIVSFLQNVREQFPNIKTILGGPHITFEYHSTLTRFHELIDVCVIGEGEDTTVEVVKSFISKESLDNIPGIAFWKDGGIVLTDGRKPIEDTGRLFPDWDSLPMDRYWDVFTTKKNYARIIASRGCPYRCTFCGAPKIMGQKYRKRDPENIIKELTYLYDRHGVREFLFNDSTFNINNDWVKEICKGIIGMKRSLIWRCNVRADRLDESTLLLMKEAGCIKVIMGVESGNADMLVAMKKGETLKQITEGIKLLKKLKIPSDHGFILGMPGETVESLKQTIQYAKESEASVVTFSLATPFPGTEFFEQAKSEGLKVDDWSKFDFYGVPYVPLTLTEKELTYYYGQAVKSFYLRPSYLFKRLLEIRSFLNLKINLRYAIRIFQRKYKLNKNKVLSKPIEYSETQSR